MRRNSGQVILWLVGVILVLALIGLAAVCTPGENDHGSLGRVELVSHRHRDRCDYDDCDDRDGGKQTCFMACYITVPGLPGQQEPPPDERAQNVACLVPAPWHCDRPASLFPPTPDKIIGGIQIMGDAGIKLGSTIAQLVIDYVVTVFRFIV